MKQVNVGLVGYGFMGRAHSNAYRQMPRFFPDVGAVPAMKAICGIPLAGVKAAAPQLGWESYESSWRKLVARKDIDLIDICSPGNTHAEIAIAAAKAGKIVFCEKPLANTLREAEAMLRAAQRARVKHMISFNYRKVPAVTLAAELVRKGVIGQVYHWRGTYRQDWIVDPNFPLVWRLQKPLAGSGALGDIGAHNIDLARFIVGDISHVCGHLTTFIKKRPKLSAVATGLSAKSSSRQMGTVTVDDAAIMLLRFENGAIGTIEATRFAPGRKNYNAFEVNGSKGSMLFDFERMNELQLYLRDDPDYAQGFRNIMVTEGVHPYVGAWWPAGHIIGYEHTFIHEVRDLMEAIGKNKMPSPNFADGVACQRALDAVERSNKSKGWVKV
jgi:predicted dehydrogenase